MPDTHTTMMDFDVFYTKCAWRLMAGGHGEVTIEHLRHATETYEKENATVANIKTIGQWGDAYKKVREIVERADT